MADSGKSNEQVVYKLIDNINRFADAVREDAAKMMREAESLHSQWNDPQYDKFRSFMSDLTRDLGSDARNLRDCADKLKSRADEIYRS